ncbi:MAG: tRNA (adenosine(37)-N6)-dimethylallyltransferase MiaA [Paludibacteraceae bacterium]|nr:tRNA (adenosine(37)-N6)-dimethylallyltransferase MiaA [Paludibacteraceae bacterium]
MKTLLLLLGPTGVGKTELSLRLAEHINSPVVSCDSRQVFREIPIGTAAPTLEEQARVRHYFIGTRSVTENYSAGGYERDAMSLLDTLFASRDTLLMTGGSMLYADAVCNGLDDLPPVPGHIRQQVTEQGRMANGEGLKWLQNEVQRLDPDYWDIVDRQNPARLAHCIELSLTTGQPYSSLRTATRKKRPFRIVKVALTRPREQLYERINKRVEQMMDLGLEQEARTVYPLRQLPALQTVGFREMFGCFDGLYNIDRAIELIRQNSRHYAKRQLTWFRRDEEIQWLDANNDHETNIHIIDNLLGACGVQERD